MDAELGLLQAKREGNSKRSLVHCVPKCSVRIHLADRGAMNLSGRPSTARSELRQESSESETASHGSDVPAEDPGARTCRDSGREQ